jgi:uncharacterized DUF497 family protein
LRTHGVSFEEASTVFDDPRGGLRFDLSHSDLEDRFLPTWPQQSGPFASGQSIAIGMARCASRHLRSAPIEIEYFRAKMRKEEQHARMDAESIF